MKSTMKDPKHFAQIVRVKGLGQVSGGAVILTPPLDTAEQAKAYAVWFNTEGNHLRQVIEATMRIGAANDTFVVRTFETTLY